MNREKLSQQLLAMFVEELETHVAAMNRDLLDFERSTSAAESAELLHALFRTTHTIKGASRAASAPLIEHASHALEDVLSSLREQRLVPTKELFTLLFATTDALADAGERLRSATSLDDAPLHAFIGRLAAVGGRETPREVSSPAIVEPPPPSVATPAVSMALRVPAERASELLAQSGELVASILRLDERAKDLASLAPSPALARFATAFEGDRRRIAGAVQELDGMIKRLRMVPFSEGCQGLARVVRDLTADGEKDVELVLQGGEIELDRAVLDAVRDPLLHLVRNAVDHGIESVAARTAAGKSPRGRITVSASLRGAEVYVTIADDGAGLDLEAIRGQLRRRNLPEAADDRDAARSIFLPGFSTARVLTDVSGRGVGLDLVKQRIEGLRGAVDIAFRKGEGTEFLMRVPLTLTTLRALLVRATNGHTYVIPGASVKTLLRVGPADVHAVEGVQTIILEGRPIPLVSLTDVLGFPSAAQLTSGKWPVVVIADGSEAAIIVDELVEECDVVVKSLGPRLRGARVVSGATLLSNGRVALILDVPEAVRRARTKAGASTGSLVTAAASAPKRRVLVVDDSMTTRSLEKSILEAAGYTVLVAVDGVDAWRLLQESVVDLIVSDVEMPRMDGFALTEAVRESPRFRHLPVVLVTGLSSEEHRARGLAVGANAYLVKSAFDQQNLLDTIGQLS